MYLVLEYLTYFLIVAVLAGILFGASVLAIVTKEKAPRIAEASMKAIHGATSRFEEDQQNRHLPAHSSTEAREA